MSSPPNAAASTDAPRLPPPLQLDDAHTADFMRLSALLDWQDGFQLVVAQFNDVPYRDQIIAQLNSKLSHASVHIHHDSAFDAVEQQLIQAAAQHALVHVLGLDNWLLHQVQAVRGLDYHRESLAQHCRAVLLVWLPVSQVEAFALAAPDLWAWRAVVLDFSRTVVPIPAVFGDKISLSTAEVAQKRRRLADIADYLAQQPEEYQATNGSLLLEASDIYISLAEYESAMEYAEQALALNRQVNNKRGMALSWGRMAEIFDFQGQWDEALRIRRDKELAVYQTLGDMHSYTRTQLYITSYLIRCGKIDAAYRNIMDEVLPNAEKLGNFNLLANGWLLAADIHHERGDRNTALNILEQKALPCFQTLGDQVSVAGTWGRIADILITFDRYDEALQIYQNQQLPIYKKLGDLRHEVWCWGNIALVYRLRGQLAESLSLLQYHILPKLRAIGDIHTQALAWGNMAEIFRTQGRLAEALHIYRENVLPVFQQTGDRRATAECWMSIADILQEQGQLTDAISIIEQQALPNIVQRRDKLNAIGCRRMLAALLLQRNEPGDAEQAASLLHSALTDAQRLNPPETTAIRELMDRHGIS